MQSINESIKNKFIQPYNYPSLSVSIIYKSTYFTEIANELAEFLEEKKHTVLISDALPKGIHDVYLIFNPIFQFPNRIKKNKHSLYCAIQTEQLNTTTQRGFRMLNSRVSNKNAINILKKFDCVFDFSRENVRYLRRFIKNVRHINYGYSEKYDLSNYKDELYDLIFIGSQIGVDKRRQRILDNLKPTNVFYPSFEDVWGDKKYQAISNSKIALNIHFDHSVIFESFRFFEYLSQKTLLITEHTMDSYPFVEGLDYIAAHQKDFPDLIRFYLKNKDLRAAIAENGYMKAKIHTRQNSFSFLLHCVEVDLAHKRVHKVKQIIYYTIMRSILRFKNLIFS